MTNLKTMMLSALAFAALASCTKQETFDPLEGKTSKMTLSFSLGDDKETRVTDTPGNSGKAAIKSLTLEFYKSEDGGVTDGRLLKTVNMSDAEIADLKVDGKRVTLPKVPDNANWVRAYANDTKKEGSTTVADFQVAFVDIPLTGQQVIASPVAGKDREVKVSLSPVVGRFEIKGNMKSATYAKNGVANINVEELYINNYLLKLGGIATKPTDIFCGKMSGVGTGWHQTSPTPQFASDKTIDILAGGTDAAGVASGKVQAFQFFPVKASTATPVAAIAECPHIVIKLSYDVNTEANGTGTVTRVTDRWITLNVFKVSGVAITEFPAGKIWGIDLAKVLSSFKPNPKNPENPETPTDPDPESPKSSGDVEVDPGEWENGGDVDFDI